MPKLPAMKVAGDEEVYPKRLAKRNTDLAKEIQAKTPSSARSKWYELGIDIWCASSSHVQLFNTILVSFAQSIRRC
jgi:hypothetical protein